MNPNKVLTPEELDEVLQPIRDYSSMLNKALLIADGPPYNAYVEYTEFASLLIAETNHIRLTWPEVDTYYESTTVERQSVLLEPTLFTMTAEEITAWQTEQRRVELERANVIRKQRAAAAQQIIDNNERAELARLKAKYEVNEEWVILDGKKVIL